MEPPPASLEAMVQSGRRERDEGLPSWLLWVGLGVAAAAITGYLMR